MPAIPPWAERLVLHTQDLDASGHSPAYELAYAEGIAPVTITATTAAGADVVATLPAVTLDGSMKVLLSVFAPYGQGPSSGAKSLTLVFFDGSTQLGEFTIVRQTGGSTERTPINLSRRATPSAGVHTFSWRAYVDSGSGVVGAGAGGAGNQLPLYIRMTRA